MLDILNLQGLEVAPDGAVEIEKNITLPVGRCTTGRSSCPHCGSSALAPNGSRSTTYMDTPMRGKPVFVQWQRQRFKCKAAECGKTCTDTHDEFHDEFHNDFLITRRLYEWLGFHCLAHTYATVALDVGLDERMVRRVFGYWSEGQAHIHHNGLIKIANRNGRGYSLVSQPCERACS